MTKKKKGGPTLEEVLARPWCYYCERDFDDMTVLLSHQKAKHYKCERCGRRLNTAGGLSVHLNQVHKENLNQVENALPNRQDPNIEIFGTEGIPEDVMQQHQQRVIAQYHEEVAERRAATGNPPPGSGQGPPTKKLKTENPTDIKKRLAEHKAKKAAEAAAAVEANNQGSQTPDAGPVQSADVFQQYAPQANPQQPNFSQTFGQPGFPAIGQPPGAFSSPTPGFAMPTNHMPPGVSQYQAQPQSYHASAPAQYVQRPPYGSPGPVGLPQGRSPGPNMSPAQSSPFAAPPGLPQRPMSGAPGSAQFHQAAPSQPPTPYQPASGAAAGDPRLRAAQANAATQQIGSQPSVANLNATNPTTSAGKEQGQKPEKKSKKDKDKPTKLLYSDNEISPEEKMAKMAKYAFNPADRKEAPFITQALGAHVTGPATGEDDVRDNKE